MARRPPKRKLDAACLECAFCRPATLFKRGRGFICAVSEERLSRARLWAPACRRFSHNL